MTPPLRSPKLVVVTGVFFVSLSAILIRLSEAPPLVIAAYRMSFAVLLMIPSMLRGLRGHVQALTTRRVLLSLASGTLLALHFAAWITSLFYTTVAGATVLVNTHAIFAVLFGFLFLGERITSRGTLFMALAFGGSGLLAYADAQSGGETVLLGSMLALSGAVTVAGYMTLGRFLRREMSLGLYTFIVYTASAGLLIAAAGAAGHRLFPQPPREYLLFAGLAVFPTLLGHSLFNWSLRYLKTSFVSTAILGEPVFASILAVFVFAEIPGPLTLVGGVVVIVALYFFIREESRVSPSVGGTSVEEAAT